MTDTAATVSAIAERRDDLAGLVANTNTAFRAIGDQNVALDRALELLPSTLRKANTTFVNLRATLDDLDALVDESKPATKGPGPLPARAAAAGAARRGRRSPTCGTLIRAPGSEQRPDRADREAAAAGAS